jgi:putative ATPase
LSDLDLFGPDQAGGGRREAAGVGGGGPDGQGAQPLAARMRPRDLDEFRGQERLLGAGRALRAMIEDGRVSSMILWGPPGSGKTTLARIMAARTDAAFVAFSAVTEGVARVREIIAEARQRLLATGRSTILFCDEIHRFNKAQQDAFLPHVEAGTVILVGATTENPSFEIVRPLLSRAPVYVLEPLDPADLRRILESAVEEERGLASMELRVEDDVLDFVSAAADGDARRALGILETAAQLVGEGGTVDLDTAREALHHRFAAYDKSGEEHYNLISALQKAVRGSDPDGALYWLARMLEAGEDPLYVARRLVRMAVEDIGLADPGALEATVAARDAYHFLGSPEGELALAQATIRLAASPKSNRVYEAWKEARSAARETPAAPVPLHIRNAPTSLMKELGYGAGYRYDPSEAHGVAPQGYLPEALEGARFYRPGPYGREPEIQERMRWFEARRREASQGSDGGEEGGRGSDPAGSV